MVETPGVSRYFARKKWPLRVSLVLLVVGGAIEDEDEEEDEPKIDILLSMMFGMGLFRCPKGIECAMVDF